MRGRTKSIDIVPPTALEGARIGGGVRFISKFDIESDRFIRQARAIYDSIYPPAHAISPLTARNGAAAIDRSSKGDFRVVAMVEPRLQGRAEAVGKRPGVQL